MKKYKVKLGRTQNGKKLDWEKEEVIQTSFPPKVGDGKVLLVDPPIFETITKVTEL